MPTKISAGIIGTGFIGPAHVEAARRLGNVEFVAIAEANEQLAGEKAAALSIPRSYGDYRQLLADPDIQVVLVTAYSSVRDAVDAIKLGAADYVEKPIDKHRLSRIVETVLEKRDLHQRTRILEQQLWPRVQ